MLNFIRQKRDKIKWVLWIVIVGLAAGMVMLFVAPPSGPAGQEDLRYLIKIDNREYGRDDYLVAANLVILDRPQLKQQSNIKRNKNFIEYVLHLMQMEYVETTEAARLGFGATDDEVRDLIGKQFSPQGPFDYKNYVEILSTFGLTPEQFEDHIKKRVMIEKYREFLCASAAVSDEEAQEFFNDENDKAKVRYLSFSAIDYYQKVAISDEMLRKYYEAHKDEFKIGETRTVKYVFFDVVEAARKVKIADAEILSVIQKNRDKYPHRIHAAHILVKTAATAKPEEVEAAKKKAEEILAKVKAPGADFAALAIEFSEDPGTGKMGGDLSYFARQDMVTPFSDAAFALKKGEVSGLVKTDFGWHIIKMIDDDDFNFYKIRVAQEMGNEKAFQELKMPALRARDKIVSGAAMEAVAKEFNATVRTSQAFNQEIPDFTIGSSPEFIKEIFALKINELATLNKSNNGYIIPRLVSITPAHILPLEKVQGKVRSAVQDEEGHKAAQEATRQFIAEVRAKGDFKAVAEEKKLKVTESEMFSRSGMIDRDLAECNEMKNEAFRLQPGDIGGPIRYKYKEIAYQLVERLRPDFTKFAAEKEKIRTQLLQTKKRSCYIAILDKIYKEYRKAGKFLINEKMVASMSDEQE